jgi:predicted TIM-barrel fold metal-dependent hydrolase
MIIDFEHHYIPLALAQRMGIKTDSKVPVRQGDAAVHVQLFDIEAQRVDMDKAGIGLSVQSCILGWDTTLENCRLINDQSAQLQRDHPGRFACLAHVPPLEGEPALAELDMLGRTAGRLLKLL